MDFRPRQESETPFLPALSVERGYELRNLGYGQRKVSWCGPPEKEDSTASGHLMSSSQRTRKQDPEIADPSCSNRRPSSQACSPQILWRLLSPQQPTSTVRGSTAVPASAAARALSFFIRLTPSAAKRCRHKSAKLVGGSVIVKGPAGSGKTLNCPYLRAPCPG